MQPVKAAVHAEVEQRAALGEQSVVGLHGQLRPARRVEPQHVGAERPGALPCQLLDHGTGYLCAAAALQALARQSARGGTQFRELSLARTAHWLLGQPREVTETPSPSDDDDERTWLTTLDSAAGPVTTVLPPGRLDDEPLTWPRALSRYGADDAAWPRLPSRCPTPGSAHLD